MNLYFVLYSCYLKQESNAPVSLEPLFGSWVLIFSCSGGWTISGTPLDLRDPRLLAIGEAERQFLEAEYDEYAASNASGAEFCRSAALIVSYYPLILFWEIICSFYLSVHIVRCSDSNSMDHVSLYLYEQLVAGLCHI